MLYEIGEREPALIAPFADEFIDQVSSNNNRMVWGAMTALGTIAGVSADAIWRRLGEVIDANDAGSVITQDWGIRVLATVSSTKKARETRIFPYLIAFLGNCIPRDVPKHAESMLVAVHDGNREKFVRALKAREKALKPSQMARLRKVYGALAGRQTR